MEQEVNIFSPGYKLGYRVGYEYGLGEKEEAWFTYMRAKRDRLSPQERENYKVGYKQGREDS